MEDSTSPNLVYPASRGSEVRVLSSRQGNKQQRFVIVKPLPLVSWVRIPHLLLRVGGVVKRDSPKNTFPEI